MDFLENVSLSTGIIICMVTGLWLVSLALRNSSIVDVFWGTGFVIVNFATFSLSQRSLPQTLLTVLVTLWGLRLSVYIYLRNKGRPEDFRYAQWRREHGARWWWVSFFKVFCLQGVLLLIIALPLIAVQTTRSARSLSLLDFAGTVLWTIGFFFEAAGDYQLARFRAKSSNAGKVMRTGLWRYTRHPNYFGDTVQWWGLYALAAASGAWWAVLSPVLMTILLLRVSGVTLLEQAMKTRPGYEEYVRTTNAFLPWFPRQ